MNLASTIAQRLSLPETSVRAVLNLLDEDQTIPFMARYRKEVTGNLDEVVLLNIRDERDRVLELEARRSAILASLKETGNWTQEREARVQSFLHLSALEDYFLPFRPKRKTRASIALEKGLGPFAEVLWKNQVPSCSAEDLAGAQDIVAERLSESAEIRRRLRERFLREGRMEAVSARGAPADHAFREHVGHSELLATMPSHRLLALLRGETERLLSLSLEIDLESSFRDALSLAFGRDFRPVAPLEAAVRDSLKRLVFPSLENETVKEAREKAEKVAIRVFAENLRQLLLAAPLGPRSLLAVDPGFRTGCKVVCLSQQGSLLDEGVIYPLEPHRKTKEAEALVRASVTKYHLQAVAVGNGTGGRESEAWLKGLKLGIPVFSVNESGASVYSASPVAREEFPNFDLTVRGAVSIGRRLMDPLAELVKIDPKSLGVGQYQHDVDQKELKRSLDDVVVSCVNLVGVDVNTATKPILTYVAGLNPRLATAIVEHRESNGRFRRRRDLLKVKGLGPKAFEQSAGFLRIHAGDDPLDATAVHPESYPVVEKLARHLNCPVKDLLGRGGLSGLSRDTLSDLGVGSVTLNDILKELEKPGRDPRPALEVVTFDDSITAMEDLKEGQILNGIVTNVTQFGAFVDIGVHQDGLIHVSQLANSFVKDALEVVKPGQTVKVMVLSVDLNKKRISLSRKALL